MVRRDGAEARRERMRKILQFVLASLEASNGSIPLDKTIARLAINLGLTRETIMEYLTIFADDDRFILDIQSRQIRKFSEG